MTSKTCATFGHRALQERATAARAEAAKQRLSRDRRRAVNAAAKRLLELGGRGLKGFKGLGDLGIAYFGVRGLCRCSAGHPIQGRGTPDATKSHSKELS